MRRRVARPDTRLWRIWAAIPAVLLVGLITAVLAGAVIQLLLRQSWLGTPSGTDETRLDTVRLALYVVGGIGGVIALVVAYRKQRITEDANTRENSKNFNDRFLSACAELGNDSAAVRLAAAYAVARLADDWRAERQTCIDVLCAYLRLPYELDPEQAGWKIGEREVRLSIIRAIRDHLRKDRDDPTTWQGYNFDFTGTTFDGGDLTGAVVSGGVLSFVDASFRGPFRFVGATLSGGAVDFERATVQDGLLSFENAMLTGATVRFNHAQFLSGEIDFTSATLSGGEINFTNATFVGIGVHFFYTSFAGARVAFLRTQFEGGEVDFDAAVFTAGTVDFTNADFIGGEVTLERAKFDGGVVDLSAVTHTNTPPALPQGAASLVGLRLPARP